MLPVAIAIGGGEQIRGYELLLRRLAPPPRFRLAQAACPAEVTIVVDAAPANQPPAVQIAATPRSGPAPVRVRFTSAARDPEGKAVSTVWDSADGKRPAVRVSATPTALRARTRRR